MARTTSSSTNRMDGLHPRDAIPLPVISARLKNTGGVTSPQWSQTAMGIWIELGIFLVVIAFGFYQLHDVKKAQRERRAREQAAALADPAAKDQRSGPSCP